MRRAATVIGFTAGLLGLAAPAAAQTSRGPATGHIVASSAAAPGRTQLNEPAGARVAARQAAPAPSSKQPGRSTRRSASKLGPVRGGSAGLGSWAVEATYAIFYLLSAAVLVVTGIGLLLPVLGGFALLGSLAVGSLIRRPPSGRA